MSNAGRGFRTYLLTKSGVTDEVGTRIHRDHLPQDPTLPAVVFHVISDVKEHHMGGASLLAMARVQLDVIAETFGAAQDAAEAIRNAADGYSGTMGSEYAQTCQLDSQQHEAEDPQDASDAYRWVISQDWIISITETAPTL
jgi:hypothetical protein